MHGCIAWQRVPEVAETHGEIFIRGKDALRDSVSKARNKKGGARGFGRWEQVEGAQGGAPKPYILTLRDLQSLDRLRHQGECLYVPVHTPPDVCRFSVLRFAT